MQKLLATAGHWQCFAVGQDVGWLSKLWSRFGSLV